MKTSASSPAPVVNPVIDAFIAASAIAFGLYVSAPSRAAMLQASLTRSARRDLRSRVRERWPTWRARLRRAAAAALSVAAILPFGTKAADKPVLVVGDQAYNAQSLFEASGALQDAPYTVAWKQFPAGTPVIEAVNAGALDIGLQGDGPVLFLAAQGAPVKVIGIYRDSPDSVVLLAGPHTQIKTVADLKGKTVAITRGGWSQQLVQAALTSAGLPLDSVKYSYLASVDSAAALQAGKVDATATWEPYVTRLREAGARTVITARGLIAAQSYLSTTQKVIDTKRELLGDFVQRYQRAREWPLADARHIERYADVWAARSRVDPKLAHQWFSTSRIRYEPLTESAIAEAQKSVDDFVKTGTLTKGFDVRGLFDTSFNKFTQAAR
ncbi:aliphatic sulfonate ABC transporter substrate-binding protein [Pandoraea fibrosis]|uniref:Aliphatic sulfonate ABC transporter substrate-binding protein n=1 Tax=Pandoraea fibrosis TaxID=1891094 RepID=A0ABX6HLQ7_9BURK|nr:ABC transporter substrate-binding protein [Pandoraea fibrosis]QHE90985.1 aliphatic sulfonate ABC transporter substrate-binding protein [Pandoraea fibrosis]QHF11816.1 aliphatic sulfonate ABC transporter substrate-binding protein [Pandoraea fibrosis]